MIYKTSLLVVGLVVFPGVCWLVSADCPVQECYCDPISILCESKGFTSLPPSLAGLQSDQASLILDANNITTIPARSLPVNLTQISLNDNPIVTIDDAAFDASAFTLATLSFSHARFTRIPDALLRLHALTELTLYETPITDWNIKAMKNIGQTLHLFYFTQDGLQTFPDCVQYFSHLTELDVTGTSIETIPEHALDSVVNSLHTLSLFNNNLTAVPKALSNMTALKMLYLSQNKIVDISWLPTAAKLKTLVLDNNRISDTNLLSHVLSRYADSLDSFSLSYNKLTVVPNFSFLKKVNGFYFSNNQISDPYSGSLPLNTFDINFQNNLLTAVPRVILKLQSVTSLLLSSNSIRAIRADDVPQWIQMIQLDYNLITELTDTSFPVNSSLLSLDLDFNPILKISVFAFSNLHHLSGISLKGSKLTRVPLALTSLSNIDSIDISESRDLVCTCLEKDVRQLLNRLNNFNVVGNCGDVSVYNFFVNLSPSCPTSQLS